MFRIYPAVDIKGGRCVRLLRGDLGKVTVFSDRPWEMALRWRDEGASFLHVVDLDGAVEGRPVNLRSVERILREVDIPVQVGGGVRTLEDARLLLEMGAARVIMGTGVLADAGLLRAAAESLGDRLVVSLDLRGERVAVGGWTQELDRTLDELVVELLEAGARRVLCTDILRDGTLEGRSGGIPHELLNRGLGVIVAGGITSRRDLVILKELVPRGVEGAVVGRALYEGALSLPEVLDLEE
ncbi:MAG: 1-(5-phosphoribosyl)-5-[(5-phosphoribosylamino)methylideneamino]imidazole-4-carboxamide isomerase [Actinobacteria bacterium]|nr:1-(5-phosphoribosyl)-5-[(5-phosphoribosylamino)methylideneamino]imidazole-4-carboxamide isomerase [Actinomycetota bacterium]